MFEDPFAIQSVFLGRVFLPFLSGFPRLLFLIQVAANDEVAKGGGEGK